MIKLHLMLIKHKPKLYALSVVLQILSYVTQNQLISNMSVLFDIFIDAL